MSKKPPAREDTAVIDVAGAAAPGGFIALANVAILVMAAGIGVDQVVEFGKVIFTPGALALDLGNIDVVMDLAFRAVMLAIFAFGGVIGFRNISVLHAVIQPFTLLSLALMSLALMALLGAFLTWAIVINVDWNTFNSDDGEQMATAFGGLVGIGIFGITLAAMIALAFARGVKIKGLGATTGRMMRALEAQESPDADKLKAPPKRPWRGRALAAIGLAWMAGIQIVPNEICFDRDWLRMFNQLSEAGFLFFIFARRDFQPDADKLLAVDARSPIPFLRSFQDDEKISSQMSSAALVDWSLETRLTAHFSKIGPFVAIGNPKDKTLEIGAARARLSDDQWQARVIDWMDRARVIVLMSGVTHWVGWQLENVLDRHHADKLIILFPQSRMFFKFKSESAARLKTIQDAAAGTPWADALAALDRPERLRALLLEPGGKIAGFDAHARSRNAYHLAALAAHYRKSAAD
jgi:hypothetical protein